MDSFFLIFSRFETQLFSLRYHAHDTVNANPQYPVDRVLPTQYPRRGSTQSPGRPSLVADPGQIPPPIVPGVLKWTTT